MRAPISLAFLAAGCLWAAAPPPHSFIVIGDEPEPWPAVLSAVGFLPASGEQAGIVVVRAGSAAAPAGWLDRVEQGTFLIVEGESPIASSLGFQPTPRKAPVRNLADLRRPEMRIIWERTVDLPVFSVPSRAEVLAEERWSHAPLMASFRHGAGGVLWVAVTPGVRGYERFPYLLHALLDLGASPPARSSRLWAFFDSSYRTRVDLDYFAARWRRSGFAGLHVAAWHYFEPDKGRDDYLRRLIEACHKRGILVYAWLELPHVSTKFWDDHPEWREKTALLDDAHLDWRSLMNLANPDCFRAALAGVRALVERFDWDGVNLAELYFESLEGHANPSRFTPMNDDARQEFLLSRGFDPLDLFRANSPRHHTKDPAGLRTFLDYRAALARRLQESWIRELEYLRKLKPDLELVLTHVDDRFEPRTRDLIGADAASLLALLERHDFTFLVEDPATIWHLGPGRYRDMAARYRPLTGRPERLAIDINVVERYQDVYPTKKQTGTELFQLVHIAAQSFPRVAVYFENSILAPDVPLLPAAAAGVRRIERSGSKLAVESASGAGVAWQGPALVDGRLWPVADDSTVWLPRGAHSVEPAGVEPPMRLVDLNAELESASAVQGGLDFAYRSAGRAFAVLDRAPGAIEIDNQPSAIRAASGHGRWILPLPRGQHVVSVRLPPAAGN